MEAIDNALGVIAQRAFLELQSADIHHDIKDVGKVIDIHRRLWLDALEQPADALPPSAMRRNIKPGRALSGSNTQQRLVTIHKADDLFQKPAQVVQRAALILETAQGAGL